ncbi:MAG TPA: PKD domain-containing protein, partial [Candidatus Deferrimicrobium sp.]|nr:PKD domain-containing protein [Candidatus Deferrimicrobium sp.]
MIKRIMCFSMFFAVMVMSSFAQDSICCPVASNLDQENTTITFQLSGTTTFTRAGIALSPFPGENPDVMMSIDGVGGPYQPGTNQMSIEIKYKGLQLYCSVYVTNSSGDSGRIFSEEIPITIPQNYVCCQEVSNLDQPDMTLNFQILKDPEQFGLGFFVWSTIPGIEFFKNNFQGGSSFVAPFQVGPNQKSIPTADIPRGIPIYYTVVYMGEYGYLFTEEASFTLPVANQAPVANAGAGQTVHSGTSVTLDGSLSTDPDGNIPLTYAWTILQKPSGSAAALATPNQVSTSINIDLPGEYRVRLIVTDSLGLASAPAQVIINSISVIPASEREALIALYNSTNGDGWLDNSGW